MTALVTLTVAKEHLRVDHAGDDADIQRKLEQASEIVIDYIKKPDHGWTDADAPLPVQAAVLIMLTRLYDYRDPGEADNAIAMGYLPREVTSILHRMRDPALA